MQRRSFLQTIAAIPAAAGAALAQNPDQPVSTQPSAHNSLYDPRLHLFIDDHGIISTHGVDRVLGRVQKHPVPVVQQDRPWESPWVYAWGSVLREPDSGQFRMWYESMGYAGDICLMRTCYAESGDGIVWHKPNVGRYAMDGYDQTNILLMTSAIHRPGDSRGDAAWQRAGVRYLGEGQPLHELVTHCDGTNVVRDEREPDATKRYKMVSAMWRRDQNGGWSHNLLTSPDGIDWTMPPEQLLKVNDGTKVLWDPARQVWVLTWLSSKLLETGEVIRYPEISESPDLRVWTHIGRPFEFDEQDGDGKIIQGHFLLPFAYGDQYVGIANLIHTMQGWAQGFLVSSRDGRKWDRPFRQEPFVPIGSDDAFDADSAEASLSPPFLDELFIYYCGRARRHWAPVACTGAIGLLRIKRDRFAGLANGGWFNRGANNNESETAEVLTQPVEVTGPELYVNVRSRQCFNPGNPKSRDWGNLRVELLDESRQPIPGYTLDDSVPYRGDEVRAKMKWRERPSVAELAGRKVHVRFSFNMSTLYAYLFA